MLSKISPSQMWFSCKFIESLHHPVHQFFSVKCLTSKIVLNLIHSKDIVRGYYCRKAPTCHKQGLILRKTDYIIFCTWFLFLRTFVKDVHPCWPKYWQTPCIRVSTFWWIFPPVRRDNLAKNKSNKVPKSIFAVV